MTKDPVYILFNGAFIMGVDEDVPTMFRRLKINPAEVKSYGTVEVGKWVCFDANGERDIDATLIMRRKWMV